MSDRDENLYRRDILQRQQLCDAAKLPRQLDALHRVGMPKATLHK